MQAGEQLQANMAADWTKVAGGTWYYDGTVPKRIDIVATPVELAASRYDPDPDYDRLIGPVRAAPVTADGFVYYVHAAGVRGEFHSLAEAKAAADAQPWGPVHWDE